MHCPYCRNTDTRVLDSRVAEDGSAAYAVLRDTSQLAIIDLGLGLPTASEVELVDLGGDVLGSMVLSPSGEQAVFFTNASVQERLTLVGLAALAGLPEVEIRSTGRDPEPMGSAHPLNAPYQAFRTADGWIRPTAAIGSRSRVTKRRGGPGSSAGSRRRGADET